MMEILEEDHGFYKLSRDESTDRHILEVECGTTAVFTVTFDLTAEEIAKYRADKASIRSLAYDVLDYPGEYLQREI